MFGYNAKIKALQTQIQNLSNNLAGRSIAGINTGFLPINSTSVFPKWDLTNNQLNYISNIDVFNVVNKVAETTSAVPLYTYLKKPDPVEKHLRSYKMAKHSDLFKGLYRVKSLEDAPETDALNILLQNPNSNQTQQLFILLCSIYYLIHGEVFILKWRTGAERGSKVIGLYIFAAPFVTMKITGQFPYDIVAYDILMPNGELMKNVPPGDLMQWKGPNTCYAQPYDHLRGMSKLKVASKTIDGSDTAMNRGIATMKNGGLPAIVYLEGMEQADIPSYEAWKQEYIKWAADVDNAGAAMPMAGKAGILQTGLKMADLALVEQGQMYFKKLCSLYNVSHKLFDQDGTGSENSITAVIKQLYTNACIPLADSFTDVLNKYLCPEFDKAGPKHYVDFDFSQIPELQQDIKYQADAIASLPVSPTGNEIREWVLKLDKVVMTEMDVPLVKSGYLPINNTGDLPAPMAGL
jgi:HK97 family phage portal protein